MINIGSARLGKLKSLRECGIEFVIPFANSWLDYGGMLNSPSSRVMKLSVMILKHKKSTRSCLGSYRYSQRHSFRLLLVACEVCTAPTPFYKPYAQKYFSEPCYKGCQTKVITEWAATMPANFKTLGQKHLASLCDEGFSNCPGNNVHLQWCQGD
jgi:mannan endo-1,4-beta-mannosidase